MIRWIILLLTVAVLQAGRACAAESSRGLPDWLVGEWVVSKIYENHDRDYAEPDGEPVNLFRNQTLIVKRNRLKIINRICIDFEVRNKQDSVVNILKHKMGYNPNKLGVESRTKPVSYIEVRCGKGLIELDGKESDAPPPFPWFIIPITHDKIEMPFVAGAYLELTKVAMPGS